MTAELPAVGDVILVACPDQPLPHMVAVGVVATRGRKWVTYRMPSLLRRERRVWPENIIANLGQDADQGEAIRVRLQTLAKEHDAAVIEAGAVWKVAVNKIIAKVTLG